MCKELQNYYKISQAGSEILHIKGGGSLMTKKKRGKFERKKRHFNCNNACERFFANKERYPQLAKLTHHLMLQNSF